MKQSKLEAKRKQEIRNEVISGLIVDKFFDIPVSIYDELNPEIIASVWESLYKQGVKHSNVIAEATHNEDFNTFIQYVRVVIPCRDRRRAEELIWNRSYAMLFKLMTFSKNDWEYAYKKYYKNDPDMKATFKGELVWAMAYPELDYAWINLFDVMTKHSSLFEEKGGSNTLNLIEFLSYQIPLPLKSLVELIYLKGLNSNYQVVDFCLSNNVPVLFNKNDGGDITDFIRYITTVLESRYSGELDPGVVDFIDECIENSDYEVRDMLFEIGNSLNHSNLVYYYRMAPDELRTIPNIQMALTKVADTNQYGHVMTVTGWIKDFKKLVAITGPRMYGLPTDMQYQFLERGGDIKTMFDDDGKLMPEASILRLKDELLKLLTYVEPENIYFLLTHSPEFLSNVMTSKMMTAPAFIHIARGLFQEPRNMALWLALNSKEKRIDAYVKLVDRIIYALSREGLFKNVPQSMLYIDPDVLFVAQNREPWVMHCAPINKTVPFVMDYILRNPYKLINRICDGEMVSITSTFPSEEKFIDEVIVKGKKYGYICDMVNGEKTTLPLIVDYIVNIIYDKENS